VNETANVAISIELNQRKKIKLDPVPMKITDFKSEPSSQRRNAQNPLSAEDLKGI
jgi:hypothetical protein